MTIIVLLMLDELLPELVLLLLLVERFDNTLLLLFDRFPSGTLVVDDDLPPGIFVILVFAWIARSILVLLYIIQSHPLSLGYLLLFLVQPILVSLLTERLYHALLLLLDRRLSFHHLLMLDHHIDRMIRITDRIVLDDLLRVVVMSTVVQTGAGSRMIGGNGFDHFYRALRGRAMRLLLTVRRLVVIVHLELGLLRRRRRGRRLDRLMFDDVLRDVVKIVVVGHCSSR